MSKPDEIPDTGTFVQLIDDNPHETNWKKGSTAEVLGVYGDTGFKCAHKDCNPQTRAITIKFLQTGKQRSVWACRVKPL